MTKKPRCIKRKRWRRKANGVRVPAKLVGRPKNVGDIIHIIRWAEANGMTVRAVGVGHSFSDVVDSTGIIIDMSKITGVVGDIDVSQIQHPDDPKKPHAFVTVRAGTSIKELNKALRKHKPPHRTEKMPLALEIMGSYDAQLIAGAVSTGTHGSGKKFGPIESQVVALKILTTCGNERELRRDADHVKEKQEFLAAVISMGCAGIITEMTLRVVPAYYLFEERSLKKWTGIRRAIASGLFQNSWRHSEVALDPYPLDEESKRTCLVTKRRLLNENEQSKPHGKRGWASWLARHSKLLKGILASDMRKPEKAEKRVRCILNGLAHKGYCRRSDKVLQLGAENEAVKIAEGIECMFHVADQSGIDHVLNVVDKLLVLGECRYKAKKPFLSSPILMRFVGCSDALVAPQWGDDLEDYVVALEMGVIESIKEAREILKDCEDLMVCERGRPHWGLNFNHYCQADIKKAYGPRFEDWKKIVRNFNASHVFDNALTKRLGIWTDPPEEVQPT